MDVQGLGMFRVQGLGFRWFRVQGCLGFKVWELRISGGLGFRDVQGLGLQGCAWLCQGGSPFGNAGSLQPTSRRSLGQFLTLAQPAGLPNGKPSLVFRVQLGLGMLRDVQGLGWFRAFQGLRWLKVQELRIQDDIGGPRVQGCLGFQDVLGFKMV